MSQAFIIMQIGDKQLDHMCEVAIVPALKECGLDPKRVDKHNEGDLLKSEIIEFIRTSDIIVADLTNERPNCYLEVGYAMGVNKNRNLILTARDDHRPGSTKHKQGGPKIHFDLSGYDILFWDEEHLERFKSELEKRVKRRMQTIGPEGEVRKAQVQVDLAPRTLNFVVSMRVICVFPVRSFAENKRSHHRPIKGWVLRVNRLSSLLTSDEKKAVTDNS